MTIMFQGGGTVQALTGAFFYDGVPTALPGGSVNDLRVNDSENVSLIVLNTLAASSLTGITNAREYRELTLVNQGPANCTIVNNSGLSQPQNRIATFGANIVMTPGGVITLLCQNPLLGWSVKSASTGLGGSGTVNSVSMVVPNDFVVAITSPTINPVITVTHGALRAALVPAGANNNFTPGGTWPVGIDRLDLDPSLGAANITGLVAGQDGQRIIISNVEALGGNNLTLNAANAGSVAANQFRASADFILPPQDSIEAVYYGGAVVKWVLVP